MAEDYYKTLGVHRDASQAEIQKAYRELARKHHPDMNPNDKTAKTKFQQVQKAFDVLNDQEKREMYDRYGSSFETMGGGAQADPGWGGQSWPGGGPGGRPSGVHFEDVDLSQLFGERYAESAGQGAGRSAGFADIFNQFRRGGRKPPSATSRRRGADLTHEVHVPFATAINGGQIQLAVQRRDGKTETIEVKIPQGIQDGKKIRVRGQGEPAPQGGTPGDILISVRVTPHPHFQRRGNHLHVKVPVALAEAILGAKIDLPTPRGAVTLSIPPGTSSGAKLRVKGHGVSTKGGQTGDLLAEIQIVLPKDLTEAERTMIREIGNRQQDDPRAKLQW